MAEPKTRIGSASPRSASHPVAALKEWIPVENPEDDPGWFDQSNPWQPREIRQDDRILVLDAD